MKTLNKTITARFFRSPEDYDRLIALWSGWMQDKETRRQLTAAHHLLYLILRGRDWHAAFTSVTNICKLENGGVYNWGARRAVHALHYGNAEDMLAPFRDVLATSALVLARELVPADSWNEALKGANPTMPELPDAHPSGHVYVFVRRDLPIADQMVQVAHVSLEAGQRFCVPCHCPLVLLQVADEPELQRALQHCRRYDIPTHTFTEPDATDEFLYAPMGLTAACTPPLNPAQRRRMRPFALWQPTS